MIKSFFTRFIFVVCFVLMLFPGLVKSQQTVFTENFNTPGTPQNSSFTTDGPIGTSRWTVGRSGNDFGAKIDQGFLTLTNDVGSTGNVKGWVLASTSTTNFLPAYNPILSQNAGIVSWSFNMRQLRTNPAGLTDGLFGVGYILAGTNGSTNKVGKGYAIMLGQPGTKDAIRFVSYNNGIQTYYTKLSSSTSGLADFGSEYSSIRIEYNPANNEWSMYVRKDNTASFNDPKTGTLIFQGTVVNSEFVNEALTMTGAYWNAATARNQTAFFDNISVSVVTPQIISINPDSKVANSGAFTLTVDGKGFTTASKVYWNNLVLTPVTATATKLTVTIPNSYISSPAIIPITVRNGSFISNALEFEIEPSGVPSLTLSKNILPFISTVAPAASPATETYTINGSNLTSGQTTVTAPFNFEISRDGGSTYSNSLTLASAGGPLTDGTVTLRARLKQNIPAGNYTGNITHTANGAVSKNVAVSGRVLAVEPTANATLPSFTNITSTGFRLGWTNSGNGEQRLVLIRQAAAVNGVPVDATTYNASAAFATGSLIGTDNYVVYKGNGNTVQITGLEPGKLYHISIIEFNGLPGTENYRTTGLLGSASTLNSPAGLQVKEVNTSYKIDFDNTVDGVNLDTFQGSGISKIAEPGQLDSDSWAFTGFSGGPINFGGESLEDSSYENGPSEGAEDDTGIYAFNVGTDIPNYTLGIQPGGSGTSADFNPGTITLRIQNQTGASATSFNIGYKVYVYNDQASSSKIAFSYLPTASADGAGAYTTLSTLDVTSPAAADLAPRWKAYYRVATIETATAIPNNAYFYIKWSGSLVSGTGAQDEFGIDDIEVIANPVAPNTVSFDGIAEDFVLAGNANLSNDLSVQNRLVFNGGKLAVKDKTLTLAGSVTNTTANGLIGGNMSKLVVRGTKNPTLSFDQTSGANVLDSLSVIGANANTVFVRDNFAVNQLLKVDELQTLDLGANSLTGTLNTISNNGTILTKNTTATPFASGKTWAGTGILHFNATAAQTLVGGTYTNLKLSSVAGTTAAANVTVNGDLNLPAANASATKGSLDMAAFTLTMGPDGTNTGVGEVTGIIRRNFFTTNKLYTFGHPNSSIAFPPAGTLPTAMSAKLTIGVAPTWRTGAIQRQFDIIQTGASGTKAIIRQHYLDSELNGNTETKLVFWGHKVTGAVDFEQGKSSNNITDNWVEISNANVAQYFEDQFGKVFITLDDTQGVGQIVWNGSVSDSWTTIENWTPNVKPGTDTKVIIPNANTTNNDPTLNPSETIGSLLIETGGIVNVISTVESPTPKLFLTLGSGAWQNYGTFNPGAASTIIFNNLDATISGSTTFNNITIPAGGGIRPSEGNYMSIAGTLSNSGTMFTTLIPNTIEFNGSNQVIPNVNGLDFGGYHNLIVSGTGASFASTINTLNIRGNLTLNQEIPFTGTTINMAGVSDQIIGGTATTNFNNLTVNKETGAVVLAQDIAVNGTLTLTKGNVVLGTNNLTLGSNAVAGTFDVNTMIVADGSGLVRRPFSSVGSYFFPIGENTGAPSYSPITVNVTAGTFSNAFVGVNAKNVKHPSNNSSQNYLRKYWNVTQSGITGAIATITAKYETLDVRGTEAEISAAQLNGTFNQSTNPWIKFAPLANNTLTAEGVILTSGQTSVFTGLKAGDFSVEVYGYGEFCQGSEAVLSAEIVGGDAPYTYFWSNGLPNSQNVTVPTTAVGDITYTLTVRDANGFVAVDNNSPVKVLAASVGGMIENSTQEICAGTVPNDLQLIGSVGKVLYWQMSETSDFAEFTNISNFTTFLSGDLIGKITKTTYLRAVLQNGDCAEQYSDTATVWVTSATWNGSAWIDGVVPSSTKSVIFAGNYSTSADAIVACSCQVNSGAVLTITENTSMIIQNEIINNGSLVVESDASIVQVNDEALNIGAALVKRNLSFRSEARKEYNYLISPVVGGNLKTGLYRKLDGMTPVAAPFVLYHNEANNKFYTSSGAYIAGRSLAVKEPASNSGAVPTAFFEGKLFNGKIEYNLAFSGADFGYSLVGNPYPSNLDLNVLYYDNSSAINATFQFWDNTVNDIYVQQGSGYSGNSYAIFNVKAGSKGTGVAAPGLAQSGLAGPRQPNNIVKVGQGFMVRASGANKILNYSNHMRLADNTGSVFYGRGVEDDRYWLQLTAPSGITSTLAVVYFGGGNNFFGSEDSRSLGSSDEVFSIVQTEKVAINGRSTFGNADVIPLGTRHFVAGSYTIALGGKEGIFANGQNIYLKDRQTGIVTQLNEASYSFDSTAGESTGRFEIIYQPETVLTTDVVSKEKLVVYRNAGDFVVEAKNTKITEIEVYDTSGRLVYAAQPHSVQARIDAGAFSNGIYILRVNQNGEITARKIIK